MKSLTLVVVLAVLVLISGCNGSGTGGSTAKGSGCQSFVKLLK